MFAILVFAALLGIPAILLYLGRSTVQIYFLSWLIVAVIFIINALTAGTGDLELSLLSAIASSVLSFAFTGLVLFSHWLWKRGFNK